MLKKVLVLLSLFLVEALLAQDQHAFPIITQSTVWGQDAGLIKPESVVFDEKNSCFYLSNGEQYAVGTSGFISKFNPEGELIDLKWSDGLNRPTGMAIYKNQLWVADVNRLVVIDIKSGNVANSYQEPVEKSGLNDVAISKTGEVFVTASFIHAVFKVEGDSLKLWVQDEEKLQWANGIIVSDRLLLVGGTNLTSIDIESKTYNILPSSPSIQDIDGVWTDGADGYLLSTVEGKTLWHLSSAGKSTMLDRGNDYYGDLEYVVESERLYIARGNHDNNRYYLGVFTLQIP